MGKRGAITYMPFVDCGLCEDYDTLPDLTDPDDRPVEQRAEEYQWLNTPEHGWICPQCRLDYTPRTRARTVKVERRAL